VLFTTVITYLLCFIMIITNINNLSHRIMFASIDNVVFAHERPLDAVSRMLYTNSLAAITSKALGRKFSKLRRKQFSPDEVGGGADFADVRSSAHRAMLIQHTVPNNAVSAAQVELGVHGCAHRRRRPWNLCG